MGKELLVITEASTVIGSLVKTATSLYNEVRDCGMASHARRQLLKDQVAHARSSEISRALSSLGIQNLEHVFDLFDLVDTRIGRSGYEVAYSQATHAARALQNNLDNLARRLR